jgi:hypothetical protein
MQVMLTTGYVTCFVAKQATNDVLPIGIDLSPIQKHAASELNKLSGIILVENVI